MSKVTEKINDKGESRDLKPRLSVYKAITFWCSTVKTMKKHILLKPR